MNITFAVEGCAHGELDDIYGTIRDARDIRKIETDALLICGDFQPHRTEDELLTMACPDKYRDMKDFHKYWDGFARPAVPTIFIGGNHEAPGHLRELYFGGWASENIFYLGHSGIFNLVKCQASSGEISVLRVGGISGIYKQHDVDRGHYEKVPFNEESKRSAYHVRRFEVDKLLVATQAPLDVLLTHDWPGDIWRYGDIDKLVRLVDRTGQLRQDVAQGTLGNPMTTEIIHKLKPAFAFAGHMHMHFNAIVPHETGKFPVTRFMALDKCGFRRQFVHWVTVDGNSKQLISEVVYSADEQNRQARPDSETFVCYDAEWLAVLKKNNKIPLSIGVQSVAVVAPTQQEISDVEAILQNAGLREIAPGYYAVPFPGKTPVGDAQQRRAFCEMLGISDVFSDYENPLPNATRSNCIQHSETGQDHEQLASLFFEDDFRS